MSIDQVTKEEILAHAEKVLGPLTESECMVVFNDSDPHPFGMVELGFGVMQGKHIITLTRDDVPVSDHLRAVSAAVIEYDGGNLAPAMGKLGQVMAELKLSPTGVVSSNDLDPGHEAV